jgi:hypothetical protein
MGKKKHKISIDICIYISHSFNYPIRPKVVKFYLISNWSPRLYCEYAVTNEPAKVIGIEPSTIPDNNASTI